MILHIRIETMKTSMQPICRQERKTNLGLETKKISLEAIHRQEKKARRRKRKKMKKLDVLPKSNPDRKLADHLDLISTKNLLVIPTPSESDQRTGEELGSGQERKTNFGLETKKISLKAIRRQKKKARWRKRKKMKKLDVLPKSNLDHKLADQLNLISTKNLLVIPTPSESDQRTGEELGSGQERKTNFGLETKKISLEAIRRQEKKARWRKRKKMKKLDILPKSNLDRKLADQLDLISTKNLLVIPTPSESDQRTGEELDSGQERKTNFGLETKKISLKAIRKQAKKARWRKRKKTKKLDVLLKSNPDRKQADQLDLNVLVISTPSESNQRTGEELSSLDVVCKKTVETLQPSLEPLSQKRKKLLIIDLNGLLVDIVTPPPKQCKADINICRRAVFKRPFCIDFLKFCLDRFEVAVWSSRTKKIMTRVIDHVMGDIKHKLVFYWDISQCTPTRFRTLENRHKVLVFKELRRVWEKHDPNLPWEKGIYDISNTLLLDDSPYKALLNPQYTAVFPHSYKYQDKHDTSLGPKGDLRVYLEGLAEADNIPKFIEAHPFGQDPISKSSLSWSFYQNVLRSQKTFQSTT